MTGPLDELLATIPGLPIPSGWVLQGGAAGLLGLTVLMILSGWLVPRRHLVALERDRDLWRTVALQAMGQSDALLPAAQIATEVTRALSDVTRHPEQPERAGAGS